MTEVKVHYECREHFEALVYSAALQLLEHFELPAKRDDRDMYKEHSKHWPMTERSLRQPSGIRGKGFDGLTHGMREYLKYGHRAKGPPEILLGLQCLSWWHREVWNNGRKHADQKTFGEYMQWYLRTNDGRELPKDRLIALRKLYGLGGKEAAA